MKKNEKGEYVDINGLKINTGDVLTLTIKGIGSGEVEVVYFEGELNLYSKSDGYIKLKKAFDREDIILEKRLIKFK